LRQNTERPVTVAAGANRLAGNQPEGIRAAIHSILDGTSPNILIPELWDGKAAARIVDVLMHFYAHG
jgi:UDP-N-acetylglucosamine 2-epimerase (non-hydrolysing)